MPQDAELLGHASLAALRTSPLWGPWSDFQAGPRGLRVWIDADLIDDVTLAGNGIESKTPSFVAVLKGRFGAGYLERLAGEAQVIGETRGLLRVYSRPEASWVQLTPELVLACSADRLDWLVTRAAQGPATLVRETALFKSLSQRVAFESAELAALVDDPEGKGRARLERNTAAIGVQIPGELLRAGLSIDLGPEVFLAAVAEASSAEGAESIRAAVEQQLAALASNMFVGMFGLRPFVSALHAESQGSHVTLRGQISEAQLTSLLGKLRSVLSMATAQGTSQAP
jgi:hypothetical protein